jgi:DNA invertase Pin-like site-specific DNA recombinase
MTKQTAWGLFTVSSEQQEGTLADQRHWAEQTAAEKGFDLVHAVEGVASGKLGPRTLVVKLLNELRALAPDARPTWLLLIRLDRVGRGSIVDTMLVVHEIRALGVRVWTREDQEVKVESAMEQMFVAMKAAVAAQENAVRIDKRNGVIERKKAAGLPTSPYRAYGLKLSGDGHDIADEPLAHVVREAFRLRGEGLGYHAIGNHLRAIAPSRISKKGKVKLVHWTTTGVQRLLTKQAYLDAGIIDEQTWNAAQDFGVQQRAQYPARAAHHPWPLSTALRCHCGGSMTGSTGGSHKRIRYYTCRAPWNHSNSFRRVRAEFLEAAFVELLQRLEAPPDLVASYVYKADQNGNIPLLETSIRETKLVQAKLTKKQTEVWDLFDQGLVRKETLQKRIDDLTGQVDDVTKRLAALEAQRAKALLAQQRRVNVTELISKAATLFERGEPDQQRWIAVSLAQQLGGLVIEADKSIGIRVVEDTGRQRRRT